jgi:hypothetical protein
MIETTSATIQTDRVIARFNVPTGGTVRERQAWANGYGEALLDILDRVTESVDNGAAVSAVRQWIRDNAPRHCLQDDDTTREG